MPSLVSASHDSFAMRGRSSDAFSTLFASVAEVGQAESLKKILMDEAEFNTHVPIPTISMSSPVSSSSVVDYSQVYFATKGLQNYGYESEAITLLDKSLSNATGVLNKGMPFWSFYDPTTGDAILDQPSVKNSTLAAASLYLIYRELLMNGAEPLYKDEAAIAMAWTTLSGFVDRVYMPTAMIDYDEMYNLKVNPLYGHGIWHGWGAPEDTATDDNVAGFTGPIVTAEEFPAAISDRLLGMQLVAADGSSTFELASTTYYSYPGSILGVYDFELAETGGSKRTVKMRQEVLPVDSGVDSNGSPIPNRTSLMTTSVVRDTCTPGSSGSCKEYNILITGKTFNNDDAYLNIDVPANSQWHTSKHETSTTLIKDVPDLAAWSRGVAEVACSGCTKLKYTFGKLRTLPMKFSGTSELIIQHSIESDDVAVGCSLGEGKCASNAPPATTVVDQHSVTYTSGQFSGKTLYTTVSYILNEAEAQTIDAAIDNIFEDPAVAESTSQSWWYTVIMNSLLKTSLDVPTSLTQERLDILAFKAVFTLIDNWRSPGGALTKGAVLQSATSNIKVGGVGGWLASAALSSISLECALVSWEAMMTQQIQADDLIRPQDAGMVLGSSIFNKPSSGDGSSWSEENSTMPLATIGASYLSSAMRATEDYDEIAWMDSWFPALMMYHQWWLNTRDHDRDGVPEYGSTINDKVVSTLDGALLMSFNVSLDSAPESLFDTDLLASFNSACTCDESYMCDCAGVDLCNQVTLDNQYASITVPVMEVAERESGQFSSSSLGRINAEQLQSYADVNYGGDLKAARVDWQVLFHRNDSIETSLRDGDNLSGFSIDVLPVDMSALWCLEKQRLLALDQMKADASGAGYFSDDERADVEESFVSTKAIIDGMYSEDDGFFYPTKVSDDTPTNEPSSSTTTSTAPWPDVDDSHLAWIWLLVVLVVLVLICMFFILFCKKRKGKKEKAQREAGKKMIKKGGVIDFPGGGKKRRADNERRGGDDDGSFRIIEGSRESSYEYYYYDPQIHEEIESPRLTGRDANEYLIVNQTSEDVSYTTTYATVDEEARVRDRDLVHSSSSSHHNIIGDRASGLF
eukprot:GHVH01016106.1.p1 GENE.GHVH01016106.1~~GHVH01016106.1.p1  ORF type:complete len:1086 (-),score=176.54 GHVH01016106.1:841-4098(-)